MTLQPDGKIVLAGGSVLRVAVARLDANGSPDATFGATGKAVDFGAATSGHAVALQSPKLAENSSDGWQQDRSAEAIAAASY